MVRAARGDELPLLQSLEQAVSAPFRELHAWAQRHGLAALTLTTFTDVPWNMPYYERLGFRNLCDIELTPGLRAVRAREAIRGLDAWPLTTMRRDITRELNVPRSRRRPGGSCR
jgi:hypothetical protein